MHDCSLSTCTHTEKRLVPQGTKYSGWSILRRIYYDRCMHGAYWDTHLAFNVVVDTTTLAQLYANCHDFNFKCKYIYMHVYM